MLRCVVLCYDAGDVLTSTVKCGIIGNDHHKIFRNTVSAQLCTECLKLAYMFAIRQHGTAYNIQLSTHKEYTETSTENIVAYNIHHSAHYEYRISTKCIADEVKTQN